MSRTGVILLLAAAWLPLTAVAQGTMAERIATDRALSIALERDGVSCTREHVVVRYAPGAVEADRQAEFCDQSETGVRAIRAYLGDTLDPAGGPETRVVFNVSPEVRQAHASMADEPHVYLPARRVQRDVAPYLHEAVHVLARWSRGKALWLGEGLPEHVAAAVAARGQGKHFSPTEPRGLASLAEHLDSAAGQELLPLIGVDGLPYAGPPAVQAQLSRLFRERDTVAPVYYTMSWSFVDHLVATLGLDALARIGRCDSPVACLTEATGKDVASLRTEWLARVSAR